jgi:hypothetical protein
MAHARRISMIHSSVAHSELREVTDRGLRKLMRDIR